MDHPATYEEDVFAWSQHQAAALRRLAASGLPLPNDLDLDHVAEEIEDLGRSELNAVESHLEGMMLHLVKAASLPGADAVRHWLVEVDQHQAEATRHVTRAMLQRIELPRLWRRATRQAERALRRFDENMAAVPDECPWSLEDLLDVEIDAETLLARVTPG